MRTIASMLLLICSTTMWADVLEVTIWKPMPGMAPTTLQYGQEAKAIYEKAGATVTLGRDLDGRMHFAAAFPNWVSWAEFGAKLEGNKPWAEFIDKINKSPSAEQEDHYMINVAAPSPIGAVYDVYLWQANPGKLDALMQGGMQARKIHEKSGVAVGINVDQLNRMHYLMSFDSWEAWAKFRDAPSSEEWNKWWSERSQNPTGTLTKVYTVGSL